MPSTPDLSEREQDVINELLLGKSNKQIALALGISARTVEFHLKNIFTKHQVGSRVELILRLGSSRGEGHGPNLGTSRVEREADAAHDAVKVPSSRDEVTSRAPALRVVQGDPVTASRTFFLAHGVLWAAAIVAAAIAGASKEFTTFLLPALALAALYVVGPRSGQAAPEPRPGSPAE